MSAQHTPGPWKAERIPPIFNIEGATHQVIAQNASDVGTVAIMGWFENAAEDAALISAAPDLLSALKLLMASEPLIAAATDAELEGGLDDEDEKVRTQANAWLVARAAIAKAEGGAA